jgi:hypothetical protein
MLSRLLLPLMRSDQHTPMTERMRDVTQGEYDAADILRAHCDGVCGGRMHLSSAGSSCCGRRLLPYGASDDSTLTAMVRQHVPFPLNQTCEVTGDVQQATYAYPGFRDQHA